MQYTLPHRGLSGKYRLAVDQIRVISEGEPVECLLAARFAIDIERLSGGSPLLRMEMVVFLVKSLASVRRPTYQLDEQPLDRAVSFRHHPI